MAFYVVMVCPVTGAKNQVKDEALRALTGYICQWSIVAITGLSLWLEMLGMVSTVWVDPGKRGSFPVRATTLRLAKHALPCVTHKTN